jgi:hypothetical protein
MLIRSGYLLFSLVIFAFYDTRSFAADAVEPAQLLSDDNQPQHAAPAVIPSHPAEEGSKIEVMWELDPYYTDAGINIPLTSTPIPIIRSTDESVIYSNLIKGSLLPRYMVLEASVYPMPLLGTYLKDDQPLTYKRGQIGNSSVNFIDSATAGFQEPWAISAFFGNIAKIVRQGEDRVGSNVGYTGYLISAGTKHIKDNIFIDDHWLELEWKIKGKVDYPDERLSWSFRVGGKLHDNPNIVDEIYVNIFRNNLNVHLPFISWINNSSLDMKVYFSETNARLLRQEYVVGKKYPKVGWKYTPTFDIGVVWSSAEEYSGILRTSNLDKVTLVLRPSVEF